MISVEVNSRITWTIENFPALCCKKLYSDVTTLDSSNLPANWIRYADFSLSVVNQYSSRATIRRDTKHWFHGGESDWGYTSFMPLTDLYDPFKGYLKNDILIVEAKIATINNSKIETVYLGHQKVVHFRALEKPNDDVFRLELWNRLHFDEVVQRVARHLCIPDPSRIRLTRQNADSGKPAPSYIEYKDMDILEDILVDSSKTSHIFYYEVLDNSTAGADHNMKSSSCAICLSKPKERACVPCGHVAACMSCLNEVQNKAFGCPICRAKIQQVIRIFLA